MGPVVRTFALSGLWGFGFWASGFRGLGFGVVDCFRFLAGLLGLLF